MASRIASEGYLVHNLPIVALQSWVICKSKKKIRPPARPPPPYVWSQIRILTPPCHHRCIQTQTQPQPSWHLTTTTGA